MKIQDYYLEAIKGDHVSLVKLIEMLVREKKTIKLSDDAGSLDLYLQPKHKDKMNKLLKEYMQKSEG
jgi:hypothetical protein